MTYSKLQFDDSATASLKRMWAIWQREQREYGLPSSQAEAGARMGMTQGAVSQYLTGQMPLNLNAVFRFAELFGCYPEDIAADASSGVRDRTAPTYVTERNTGRNITPEQSVLLDYFDMLTEQQRAQLIDQAKSQAAENKAVFEQLTMKFKEREAD